MNNKINKRYKMKKIKGIDHCEQCLSFNWYVEEGSFVCLDCGYIEEIRKN